MPKPPVWPNFGKKGIIVKHTISVVVLSTLGIFVSTGNAHADKPAWAGGGKNGKGEQAEQRRDVASTTAFNDETRKIIGDYYGKQARAGKCPPGLAKKKNGCLPPGQAKKWAKGKPLPEDLRYNELPRELLKRLPPPSAQHRYVQIAGDILMVAIGTNMVIDAIEDILR